MSWLGRLGVGLIAAAILAALFSIGRPHATDATPQVATAAANASATEQPAEFLAIDQIGVGQRIVAENPTGEFDESLGREVDPATWRKLTLKAPKRDGSIADVVLLRPIWWLQQRAAEVGGTVPISVPECGIEGHAQVLGIEPCPALRGGAGHFVTGTFRHQSAQVLDLYIDGQTDPIGTTANHPFWSEDRQSFVRADSLQPGERLRSPTGLSRVRRLIPRHAPEPVFNIEVLGQHVYHVGAFGLLVHNGFDDCTGQGLLQIGPPPISGRPRNPHIDGLDPQAGARSTGVDRAARLEVELVRSGHPGTIWPPWDGPEIDFIRSTGTLPDVRGHHINSVSGFPEWQGDPRNIHFFRSQYPEHFQAHGNDWHTITTGPLIDRQRMLDVIRSGHPLSN